MTSSFPTPPRSLADRLERVCRRLMSRTLDAELARVRAAGTRVLRLDPTAADLEVMGPNFMDPRRRLPALDQAVFSGPTRIADARRAT